MSCNKTKQKTKKKKIISKPTDRAAVGGAGRGVIFKAFFLMLHRIQCGPDVAALSEPQSEGLTSSLLPCPSCSALLTGGGLTRWSTVVWPGGPLNREHSLIRCLNSDVCFLLFFFSYKLKRKHLCSHFYCIKSTMRVWTPAHNPPPKLPPPLWLSLLMSCWITRSLNVFKVRGGGGPGSEF